MEKLKAKMYKDMANPTVEVARVDGEEKPKISVSLESLCEDFHNQSYGMIAGSMGCASNNPGPGC
jgi:hypothetical protein